MLNADNIFASVFEQAPEAMIVIRECRILLANREAHRLLTPEYCEDIIGLRLEQVVPLDLFSAGGILPALNRLQKGDARSFESSIHISGSEYQPVVIRATCLQDELILLQISDNTDSIEARKALYESEDRRQAMLRLSSFPMMGIDGKWRITWLNSLAADMAGASAHDLVGRACYRAMRSRLDPCESCPVDRARNGSGAVFSERLDAFEGGPWIVSASAAGQISTSNGSVVVSYRPAWLALDPVELQPDIDSAAASPATIYQTTNKLSPELSRHLETAAQILSDELGTEVRIRIESCGALAHNHHQCGEMLLSAVDRIASSKERSLDWDGIDMIVGESVLESPAYDLQAGRYLSVTLGERGSGSGAVGPSDRESMSSVAISESIGDAGGRMFIVPKEGGIQGYSILLPVSGGLEEGVER